MAKYTKEVLKIQPYFDMEAVMALLQENRLGGQVLEEMVNTFERLAKELSSVILKTEKGDYLVVWFSENVEKEADELFEKDAEKGFRFNCIGQSIIMNTVYQILPEVEVAGCAPCPEPNEAIAEALAAENIPYLDGEPTLIRRFSVLTSLPFRGACEICYLRESCPKANGQSENFHSVELPGYQQ